MVWDPATYRRYAGERGRPFADLLARVQADAPAAVVDLGCGDGALTATLLERWPAARVVGVDSSAEMLAAAPPVPGLVLEQGDLRDWTPAGRVDVVVTNAALQWVPGHLELLPRYAGWLAPGGELALQVPGNVAAPSHVLLARLRTSPRWRDRVGEGADRALAVPPPEAYLAALLDVGLAAEVWETTYLHLLTGPDPVLAWTRGTALRPVLAALGPDEQDAFTAEYAALLREAYPPGPHGTVFPFRRLFAVARRPH